MNGCGLNLTVSTLACALAEGKSQQELALLSAAFTQLGDALATIAAGNDCLCNGGDAGNNSQIINIT